VLTPETLCAAGASLVYFISPTHKRTEGRAPVWGSDFTSKDAELQGGVVEIAARLNVKLCVLVTDCLRGGGILPPYSRPILFRIYLNIREQF
jgi:hypothetical protein